MIKTPEESQRSEIAPNTPELQPANKIIGALKSAISHRIAAITAAVLALAPNTSNADQSAPCLSSWTITNSQQPYKTEGPYHGCTSFTKEQEAEGEGWCATKGVGIYYYGYRKHTYNMKACSPESSPGDIDEGCAKEPWLIASNRIGALPGTQYTGCQNIHISSNQLFCPTSLAYIITPENSEASFNNPTERRKCKIPKAPIEKKDLPNYKEQAKNSINKNSATIYFPTSVSSLDNVDAEDICKFVAAHHQIASILIEGHTDSRGSNEDNNELGMRRANSVEKAIRDCGGKAQITTSSHGEKNAKGKNHEKDRKVTILNNQNALSRGLELLQADTYLIDSSVSMTAPMNRNIKSKWEIVTNHKFPQNAEIYTFNSCNFIRLKNANLIKQVTPECGTPLWNSILTIINRAAKNSRITIITDGENTTGEDDDNSVKKIIAAAKRKRISISIISLGIPEDYLYLFDEIAKKTSGSVYSSQ